MTSDAMNGPGSWEAIEAILPEGWRELQKEYKLIRPQPPQLKTKVTDIGPLLRLVFYHVACNAALMTATAAFDAGGLLDLSGVALHKWMIKLGPYLADLTARMISKEAIFASERWAGYDVRAADATTVTRPGATGTTARVHSSLRLADLRVVQVYVTDETGGETLRRFDVGDGQLWILDRIYANPPGIAHAKTGGAEVIIRYNRGALPLYDAEGQPLDVWAKLARLRNPLDPCEWEAWVRPANGEPIRGRLCAIRLPHEKAEQARARLRREQGSGVTADSLAMADFVVLFVTVPHHRLDTKLVLELYRLRWQIELAYKRDKSITGLDMLPNFRPDTIFSWLQTKVLLHQIARKLAARDADFPPGALVAHLLPAHAHAA
jgi:Transposase DDE domain